MDEQTVDHDTDASAAINVPATTTLYDSEGRSLTVPAADEGVWLARGFRRNVADPKAALKELPALWKAALDALKAAVDDGDEALDTGAAAPYATAIMGLRELNTGIAAVLDGLHAAPVKQQEG